MSICNFVEPVDIYERQDIYISILVCHIFSFIQTKVRATPSTQWTNF